VSEEPARYPLIDGVRCPVCGNTNCTGFHPEYVSREAKLEAENAALREDYRVNKIKWINIVTKERNKSAKLRGLLEDGIKIPAALQTVSIMEIRAWQKAAREALGEKE
jgi:hypothetical protein